MKKKVYVLLIESVYDYEQNTSVFVYDTLAAAQEDMRKGVADFEHENDADCSGWERTCYDNESVCYQEPGDYTRNHITWDIFEREVDFGDMYIVPKDFDNFYIEKTQFWAGTHEAAVYTKEEADAIVDAERRTYNLHGSRGPYAVKLIENREDLIEEDLYDLQHS